MVTIPMVAGFFTYLSGAPTNIMSIMLACLSAFIAKRYKYGYIIGIIPIVLSLALYQIALGVTAALMILILILEILDNKTPWYKTLIKGFKFLATLIGGLILYLLSIMLLYPEGMDGNYQGIGQMGQIDLLNLPYQIRSAYYEIIKFFLLDTRNYHSALMNYAFILAFIACAVLIVLWCIKHKIYKDPLKTVLLAVLLILYPLACNLIYLMGPHWIHDLMIYATVLIPVFIIIIIDLYNTEKQKPFNIMANISTWVITITILLSMFNYWIVSNQVYFKLNIGYQVTYAQSIQLISRIQSQEGYTQDKDIIIIGSAYVPQGIPELQDITIIGANGPELMLDSWAYSYFLKRHLNFTQNITHVRGGDIWIELFHGNEEINDLVDIVRDMPVYPDDGSIAIIDDVIYVRFMYLDLPPYR
jgi:hypothetical protein